ncbi:unnamed protein product [Diamesa tonsa]
MKLIISSALIVLNLLLVVNCSAKNQHVWEQDLSNTFNIDASTEGLQKVQLKCGADSMSIELVTEEDFHGVLYTRGSFYKGKAPCFITPKAKGTRSLTLKFPMNQCQTIQDGDVYSNVVVVQHDPELVTTGDAAFQVECDFRKPRSITVEADFQARDSPKTAFGSRITLTSPDPSYVPETANKIRHKRDTATSDTYTVTFTPNSTILHMAEDLKERKIADEL